MRSLKEHPQYEPNGEMEWVVFDLYASISLQSETRKGFSASVLGLVAETERMMLQVQRPKEPNKVEKFTESKISQAISGTLNIYGTIMQTLAFLLIFHYSKRKITTICPNLFQLSSKGYPISMVASIMSDSLLDHQYIMLEFLV